MRRSFVLLLSVVWLIAGVAAAGTNGSTLHLGRSRQTIATGVGSGRDGRDVFLCFLGDTQSEVSQKSLIQQSPELGCKPWQDAPFSFCVGAYCQKSPWCNNNWRSTARQHMRNRAYELTGQWGKIDYSGLDGDGLEGIKTRHTQALDHPRCDAILSLGDMTDIPDGVVATDPVYSALDAQDKSDADIVRDFWQIIKASGIPFLPIPGNHDTMDNYRTLMETDLDFTALPFYHTREPLKKLEYAIKFSTATGKEFCVVSMNSISSSSSENLDAADIQWVDDNIGCGAGLPTISIQHEGSDTISYQGASIPGAPSILYDAANSDLFMIAGGHNATVPSTKLYNVAAGLFPFDVFVFYSDWQNVARHGTDSTALPYGNTPRDSAGLFYTIAKIEPEIDRVCAWDWSDYWGVTESITLPSLVPQGEITSRLCQTFDFDARFP